MKRILLLLSIVIFFSSCRSLRQTTEKTKDTTTTESTESTTDSTSSIVESAPIQDRVIINVPETDNTELNKMLDAILMQLNTSKQSGSNSYSLRFSPEDKKLIADFTVAASKVEKTTTSSDFKSERSFSEEVDEYFEQKIKRIPFWVYIVLAIWFLPQILTRVQMIINPVAGLLNNIKK
jgi:hypothetical protein